MTQGVPAPHGTLGPPASLPQRRSRDLEGKLKVLLAFFKEAGARELERVPLLGGVIAAVEKLSEEEAGHEAAERVQRLLALAGESKEELTLVRQDIDALTALTMGVFTLQHELHAWLATSGQPEQAQGLSELAVEAALLAYRARVAVDYRYADHRGIGRATQQALMTSLPLEEVYVLPRLALESADRALRDREREVLRRIENRDLPEEQRARLEEEYAALTGGRWRPGEGLQVGEALADARHAVVLGPPGVGKSVLLRWLARTCALGPEALRERLGWAEELVPIALPLARFAAALEQQPDLTLRAFVDQEAARRGGEALRLALESEWREGRVLVLLDGLDEVPGSAERVAMVRAVDAFVADLADNRCLVTSRPYGYIPLAGNLPHFQLPNFTEEQVTSFLRQWQRAFKRRQHPDTPDLARADAEADEILKDLRRNPRVLELARNPLMLVIVSLIRYEQRRLPEQRVELYHQAVDTLMHTWNLWRSTTVATNTDHGAELQPRHLVRVWAKVAVWMRGEKPTGVVHRAELRRRLIQVLKDQELDQEDPEATADAYLRAAAEQAGLLEERAPDMFGFWHATFEEYLAAVDLATPAADAQAKLLPLRGDPRWREVILLAVAHIGIVQQDDQTATKVVDALAHADSLSPVEPLTHPSLRLGLACLADDPGVRRSLAERLVAELATIMAGQPYPELVPTFVNTARALPGLRPTSATTIDALASLASHPSWEARMEATRLLSNATTKSAAARSVCERLLGDEHRDVRVHAALGLARVADLRDRDEVWVALSGYRSAAAHIEVVVREFVAQLPPDAVTRLRALATAPVNPSNHSVEIALLLAESPPAREDAVGVLTGLLGHQDPRVRIRAADALIGLACNTSQAAATLSELLAHRDSWVRLFAADTLSHLSHTLDQATTALVDLLSDPDPAVCASAAISLVSLGHIADEVTETLINLLTSPSPELRSQAAETLRHLGQAGDQLAGLLTHPDPGVCCLAATRLIRLGRTSNQVISTLVGLLSHPDLRYEAAAALIRVGAVSDDVVMALTKPRPEGRRPAAGTVASMGHKGFRAVRAAVEVATDEPSEVLNACRRAVRRPPLLQEGDGLTLAQLVKADDGDTQARRDAKAWLFSWFWWTIEDRRGSRQA